MGVSFPLVLIRRMVFSPAVSLFGGSGSELSTPLDGNAGFLRCYSCCPHSCLGTPLGSDFVLYDDQLSFIDSDLDPELATAKDGEACRVATMSVRDLHVQTVSLPTAFTTTSKDEFGGSREAIFGERSVRSYLFLFYLFIGASLPITPLICP
ncbi:hypothetical protein BU16DRAFT_540402 [Lophium mytilinum]|uniref:Uncharacterized protein n=1 Tax=Lophium mytilinum TaxID=390894 RepID=A0A6A6QNN6_9PEZI|nr:hypothetical protein BU16DRAFT_540402 [Lophium mytilinum]